MNSCVRLILISLLAVALAACAGPRHVLVKKDHFEAADQCLLAQQAGQATSREQQEHIAETLALLRESLELQRRGDMLAREMIRETRPEQVDQSCPTVDEPRRTQPAQLDKKIVGGKEQVLLTDLGIVKGARMDTGATTSSLDARDVEIFERDGDQWVRFKIEDPDNDGMIELERKRVRRVLITQSNTDEPERRPVIEMRITIGEITQVAEFTLSNRSHLEFPVLIGRNVLRDLMLVDVGQNNLTEPRAPQSSNSRD
ncbi:RimK/LysX family protein [Marinimicrobium sp. ABcell2]|uniref:ATP-dependent zinc protease family protein n=1 Tax=Marinimicrobium sp. ABcell2 TaxID=3069751 RepID=UPI0027B170D6|nr:RimK/LysX family protein [Marinimicrobium sp. ABcell2]MDQ2076809.1 RimK/LysX family protein [Marinimicrobium sp. ABcell2]